MQSGTCPLGTITGNVFKRFPGTVTSRPCLPECFILALDVEIKTSDKILGTSRAMLYLKGGLHSNFLRPVYMLMHPNIAGVARNMCTRARRTNVLAFTSRPAARAPSWFVWCPVLEFSVFGINCNYLVFTLSYENVQITTGRSLFCHKIFIKVYSVTTS